MKPGSSILPRRFYQEILNLLQKNRRPRVRVTNSPISGAGEGVFAAVNTDTAAVAMDQQQHLLPLCLYPGVYTPGLPPFAIGSGGDDSTTVYLANDFPPPSGVPNDENAYILNLSPLGGYADGMALEIDDEAATASRCLDDNPSACGHKINHSSRDANITLVPFYWKDVFAAACKNNEEEKDGEPLFELPNVLRTDSSPWYFDGTTNQVCYFTDCHDTQHLLVGAAACPIAAPLEPGQELFLNYSLKRNPEYPSWARDWYEE